MALVSSEAFVLNKFKYGDTSLIVTLFSINHGKFSALIKGARNSKSGLSGVFENINHITIHFNKKENRELQNISKSENINSFPAIKQNLDKLNVAYRLIELTNKLIISYDINSKVFLLLKDMLNTLEKNESNFLVILLYFQLFFSVYTGVGYLDKVSDFPIVSDETFVYGTSFKNTEEINGILHLIGKTKPENLESLFFDENKLKVLIDKLDYHLLSDVSHPGILKTKKIISQIQMK
jgi:hypothetical protein